MKYKVIGVIVGCSLIFAFLPIIGFMIASFLNEAFDCGVLGESGIVTGSCPTSLSDLIAFLMVAMWLSLLSLPVGLGTAGIALIVLVGMVIYGKVKRVKQP